MLKADSGERREVPSFRFPLYALRLERRGVRAFSGINADRRKKQLVLCKNVRTCKKTFVKMYICTKYQG